MATTARNKKKSKKQGSEAKLLNIPLYHDFKRMEKIDLAAMEMMYNECANKGYTQQTDYWRKRLLKTRGSEHILALGVLFRRAVKTKDFDMALHYGLLSLRKDPEPFSHEIDLRLCTDLVKQLLAVNLIKEALNFGSKVDQCFNHNHNQKINHSYQMILAHVKCGNVDKALEWCNNLNSYDLDQDDPKKLAFARSYECFQMAKMKKGIFKDLMEFFRFSVNVVAAKGTIFLAKGETQLAKEWFKVALETYIHGTEYFEFEWNASDTLRFYLFIVMHDLDVYGYGYDYFWDLKPDHPWRTDFFLYFSKAFFVFPSLRSEFLPLLDKIFEDKIDDNLNVKTFKNSICVNDHFLCNLEKML